MRRTAGAVQVSIPQGCPGQTVHIRQADGADVRDGSLDLAAGIVQGGEAKSGPPGSFPYTSWDAPHTDHGTRPATSMVRALSWERLCGVAKLETEGLPNALNFEAQRSCIEYPTQILA